jgi:chromosome segregation ATPase
MLPGASAGEDQALLSHGRATLQHLVVACRSTNTHTHTHLHCPCCVDAACQEELREKERALRELAAEADSASSQLHGLQTVLTAKTAQCNRLEADARQLERQLKQAAAAAAAEQEGLRGEVAVMSQRVAALEGQLVAAQQREQEQQAQLTAVRSKVSLAVKFG